LSAPSAFERIGGQAAVTALVDAFYDEMDGNPDYRELRRMHADDLAPMRESLAGFLTGWLGGPRDWFGQNPGKCMISMHARLPITRQTADQWVSAMRAAMGSCQIDPEIASRLGDAFADLSVRMTRLSA
jgi:hemoglobin